VAGIQATHVLQTGWRMQNFGNAGQISQAKQALLAGPDPLEQFPEFGPNRIGLLVLPSGVEEKLAVLELEAVLSFGDAPLAQQEVLVAAGEGFDHHGPFLERDVHG
jgi:hypothetical protein